MILQFLNFIKNWFSSWFNYFERDYFVYQFTMACTMCICLYFTLTNKFLNKFMDVSIYAFFYNNDFHIFVDRYCFVIYCLIWFPLFFFSSERIAFLIFYFALFYHFILFIEFDYYIKSPHNLFYIIDWSINMDKTRKYEIFKDMMIEHDSYYQKDLLYVLTEFQKLYPLIEHFKTNDDNLRYIIYIYYFDKRSFWDFIPTLTYLIYDILKYSVSSGFIVYPIAYLLSYFWPF